MGYEAYLKFIDGSSAITPTHVSFANPRGNFIIKNQELYLKELAQRRVKLSLVPKALPVGEFRSLQIDVDFRVSKDASPDAIPTPGAHKSFLEAVGPLVRERWGSQEVLLSAKDGSYAAETAEYGCVLKAGFHMHIPGVVLRPHESLEFRNAILPLIPQCYNLNEHVEQNPSKIVDRCICTHKNSLIDWGCPKKGMIHKVVWFGLFEESGFIHQDPPPLKPMWYKLNAWRLNVPEKVQQYKNLKRRYRLNIIAVSLRVRLTGNDDSLSSDSLSPDSDSFQLSKFLDALAGWTPRNGEYKKLCMYFSSTTLEPAYIGKLCNAAWNPPSDKIHETHDFIEKYRKRTYVHQGSAIYILQKHHTKPYRLEDIFPRASYKHHNQSAMFEQPGVIWESEEIMRYITQVYDYVWGCGKTEFVYTEQRQKRFGKKEESFTLVETVVTKYMPFCTKETDKLLLVKPGIEDLLRAVSKISKIRPTVHNDTLNKRISRAQELLKKGDYSTLHEFLGDDAPDPAEMKLSQFFILAKQKGLLESRYHSYGIEPYLYQDTTPDDKLNIFRGFDLVRFSREGDVKSTTIWEWLWVVWANRDSYKLEWLLNLFATKLQRPARKINKFIVAYCRQQGVGKTTIRYFLQALFNTSSVLFCDQVSEFLENENSEQLGKLWCICDDIERCGRKQADSLKSRITADTFRYKRLYENRVTMNSYLDLIGTSNHPRPVFVGDDDRRVELVPINPEKKGNTPENIVFWNDFYNELDSLETMGAWFHFLANYNITLDVTSQDCRFDTNALEVQKLKSMKLTHKWVLEFFADVDCFEKCVQFPEREPLWFSKILFKVENGAKSVFIAKDRCFTYFEYWKREIGKKTDVNKSTFEDDLQVLGLEPKRRHIDGIKRLGYIFSMHKLHTALSKFYRLRSTAISMQWAFEDDREFSALKSREWRFKFQRSF